MSRFYDALKEASRSQSNANGNPLGGGGALVSDVNEPLHETIASAPVTPPVLTPEPVLTETPALPHDELVDLATQPRTGSFPPKIPIVFARSEERRVGEECRC